MVRREKGNKRPKRIDTRRLLYELADRKCPVCGKPLQIKRHRELNSYATIDHIKPKAMGGTNHRSNLQIMCRSCNMKKSDNYIKRY